jgi:solute:Na+ symporter, SSS family
MGKLRRLGSVMAGLLLIVVAHAQSSSPAHSAGKPAAATGLHAIDWAVIVGYLLLVLGIGWYYSKRAADARDYFIAARKHIHPALVGISMFATLFSTISYIGKPGEMINKGPFLLIGQILSIPFAYLIVGYWIVPGLMRVRVTSAYELLEHRLGLSVRLLGAGMFILLRLVWMGLLVHLASVALSVILGLEPKWVPAIAATSGMIAVLYTSMGGFRSVVIVDVLQFCLILFGALATIVIIAVNLKGFSWIPTEWSPHWDRQPWFSLDPHERVTVFGATISMLVWRVATAGGDQTAVQRYMATADISAARRSYFITETATLVVTVVLALLGLALLGFFAREGTLAEGMTIRQNADHLFPYFIAHYLPVGLSGLVVAAIIASMSNVDSGVSAISAVVMRDFLQRFDRHPRTSAGELSFSRWLAFGIGVSVVTASLFMGNIPGNFMEMVTITSNLVVTPIFSLFILATWVSFATPLGAWMGCAYGLATATFIAFWHPLTGFKTISFQWV